MMLKGLRLFQQPAFGFATGHPISSWMRCNRQSLRYMANFAPKDSAVMKVQASYVATKLDLNRLQARVAETLSDRFVSFMVDKDWAIGVTYRDRLVHGASHGERTYVSMSKRGSLVIINGGAAPMEDASTLSLLPLLSSPEIARPLEDREPKPTEDCTLVIAPSASEWSALEDGRVILQDLDADNVRILNSIMAQTVNLQYYENKVDKMYEIVTDINLSIEQGQQKFFTLELNKHLATVNTIKNAIMLSGLRSAVRPGSTAWKEDKYQDLQEALQDEFDLEERYEEMLRKIEYIDDVVKYSLEVDKDSKFIRLERAVVFLIMAELTLSLLHTGVLSSSSTWLLDAVSSFTNHLPNLE